MINSISIRLVWLLFDYFDYNFEIEWVPGEIEFDYLDNFNFLCDYRNSEISYAPSTFYTGPNLFMPVPNLLCTKMPYILIWYIIFFKRNRLRLPQNTKLNIDYVTERVLMFMKRQKFNLIFRIMPKLPSGINFYSRVPNKHSLHDLMRLRQ